MIPAVLEKFTFAVAVGVLLALGRVSGPVLAFSGIDLVWGIFLPGCFLDVCPGTPPRPIQTARPLVGRLSQVSRSREPNGTWTFRPARLGDLPGRISLAIVGRPPHNRSVPGHLDEQRKPDHERADWKRRRRRRTGGGRGGRRHE